MLDTIYLSLLTMVMPTRHLNEDGSPNTAHSLNPVPCILVSDDYKKINEGILADVAPTLLTIMGIPIPKDMTGKVLV